MSLGFIISPLPRATLCSELAVEDVSSQHPALASMCSYSQASLLQRTLRRVAPGKWACHGVLSQQ